MATSFSIQDILSQDDGKGHSPSPTSSSGSESQLGSPPPDPVEVTVLESSVQISERTSSSRKRNRECSSSETSICSSEVFLSEPGSPGPIDLDALSAIDQRRKSKRPRTAFTPTQLKGLEYYFRLCPYPDSMGRDVISRVTGIDDPRIQVWFQNRRARYRKREQGIKTTTSSSTTSPAPSQPHTTHTLTLKPIQPPTPSPMLRPSPPPLKSITPGTPPTLPTPPLTPGMLGSYYAAMAYHMQRFQQTTPGMPTYLPLPLPYFLPVTQSKPQDKQT